MKGEHKCNPTEASSKNITSLRKEEVSVPETNYQVVKDMIKQELMKGKLYFHEKCITNNIKISKTKLKDIHKKQEKNYFLLKLKLLYQMNFVRLEIQAVPKSLIKVTLMFQSQLIQKHQYGEVM